VVANRAVADIASRGATISWTTDIPSNSQVLYGTTPDCPLATTIIRRFDTAHLRDLHDLRSNAEYYYRVVSQSATGGEASSVIGTFRTEGYTNVTMVVPRLQTRLRPSAGADTSESTGLAVPNRY
jgi:hypothetical protein